MKEHFLTVQRVPETHAETIYQLRASRNFWRAWAITMTIAFGVALWIAR